MIDKKCYFYYELKTDFYCTETKITQQVTNKVISKNLN